ncbi:hypothetical protein [Naasia aerilata]|uniref:Xylose isomerase-like TIM barrel domain-containing protein n=1 Tax=Naasia aerilata TaxID=1162966 RepID=A0ABN6XMH9_9MICO|nr:hypothetical protein [Naasia aerilata]BDZ46121.1 hypothetical protein GCM10025866_20300 [Naasia aerilata]
MTDTTTLGTPIQGTTLYSFTRFWHSRQMTFPELVREVAKRGLGPGLEVVGFQSIKGFPNVSAEFERSFKELVDTSGLLPVALGANADAGIRRDRLMTNDELVDYMSAQIAVAQRLGFPIVRVQYSLTPDDMERLLPWRRSTTSLSAWRSTRITRPGTLTCRRCWSDTRSSAPPGWGSFPTGAPQ